MRRTRLTRARACGATHLSGGASSMASGAARLSGGAARVTSGVARLSGGASSMASGAALLVIGLAVAALTGCSPTTTAPSTAQSLAPGSSDASSGASADGASATSTAAAIAPLGAGFLGANTSPSPEATVTPEPGSWDAVTPPEGYRVVLIADDAAQVTDVLTAGVLVWAEREGVDITTMTAATDDEVEDRLVDAIADSPNLVLGVGNGVIDVFSLITAQHLDQNFLVVGAELPEPTENVVSVVWPGASFRGTGISAEGDTEESAVTPARVDDAVTAGVASVLHGITGIVLNLG